MNTAATQLDFALAHLEIVEYDLEKSNDSNQYYVAETIGRLRRLKDELTLRAETARVNRRIRRRLAK